MITRIEWIADGPIRLQKLAEDGTVLQDVPQALTLREAARILKKSRRHIYRYIQRGWLTPLAKFSGEFFFAPEDIERLKEKTHPRQISLPPHLAPLFPDYDLKSLHLNRDRDVIMTRLLERGTSKDLRWLKKWIPVKDRRD